MEFRWIWCNVMSNEYKRIQVSSSGYVDICWTKPGCNMEIGRGCSDWCRCNFPVPSLRLLRPLANGNSHQQLSKPQSSNFKAEQSQMIMKKSPNSRIWQKESKTPNSMKKWTSSWKRQSIASHLTCMSDGEVVMGLGGSNLGNGPKKLDGHDPKTNVAGPSFLSFSSPSPNPKKLASLVLIFLDRWQNIPTSLNYINWSISSHGGFLIRGDPPKHRP